MAISSIRGKIAHPATCHRRAGVVAAIALTAAVGGNALAQDPAHSYLPPGLGRCINAERAYTAAYDSKIASEIGKKLAEADSNGDGKLSPLERIALPRDLQDRINKDNTRDKHLSFDEAVPMIVGLNKKCSPPPPTQLKAILDVMRGISDAILADADKINAATAANRAKRVNKNSK